jgi:uncharacterized membrane protein YbhN (UPF0104 family)
VYLFHVIPRFELATIHSIRLRLWFVLILLFIVVQLITILYFSLILYGNLGGSSFFKLSLVLFASHSLNYAGPMKIGIPVRVFLFKKILGIPYAVAVGAVATTTGLDVAMMIAMVTGLSAWGYVSPFAGIAATVAIVACFIGLMTFACKLPSKIPNRPAWIRRLLPDVTGISIGTLAVAILLSATRLLMTAFAGWLLVGGLGGVCDLAEFSFAYFSSLLAGLLSFLPMGIGVKDASIIAFLARMETPLSVSMAFAAVDRLIWSFLPLVIGLGSGWYLGLGQLMRAPRKELR